MKDRSKLTVQAKSNIRKQLLDSLPYYGINPNDWTCTVCRDFTIETVWTTPKTSRKVYDVTAHAFLHNKRTGAEIECPNIYYSDSGEILQSDRWILS